MQRPGGVNRSKRRLSPRPADPARYRSPTRPARRTEPAHRAPGGPPRAIACSRSTWVRWIGSTYGLRSRIERCSVGSESSSSPQPLTASTPSARELEFAPDGAGEACVLRSCQLIVEGGDVHVRPCQGHLDVVHQGSRRTPSRHTSRRRSTCRRSRSVAARPVPAPYQPGSMCRLCDQDTIQGMARSRLHALAVCTGHRARTDLRPLDDVDRCDGTGNSR